MVVKCEDIIDYMNEIAPEQLAEPWDNVGLLVGNKESIIKKALVALDATNSVIDEAIENQANLIITHHPISIKHIKKINNKTLEGRLYKLIKNDINVYSAHTNFDATIGGTNDILANILNLKNIEILEPTYNINNVAYGIGRIGTLEKEMILSDYINQIKNSLNLSYVNVVGNLSKPIEKVALCSGSGADYLETAIAKEADVYICGDIRYHDAQQAQELGISCIDITHYASENISIPYLKEYLDKKAKQQNWEIEFIISKIDSQPFKTV